MTSKTDDRRHPEVEEISSLAEEGLPPERAAEVRDHLDGCGLCADVLASLESIREILGTLPGPSRMPDDVAGRIDAALAAEALLESGGPSKVSRETARPEVDVSRETTPSRREPGNRPPGRAGAPRGPGRTGRRRRRLMALATACCAAALGIGGVVQSLDSVKGSASDSGTAQQKQASKDPSSFAAGSLEKRVHALLAEKETAPSEEVKPEFDVRSSPTGSLRAEATAVPPCIQQATHRGETALAAQPGTFRGVKSYLVVLPNATDTNRVDAYIIDSSCLRESTPRPGEVLLTRSYSRD